MATFLAGLAVLASPATAQTLSDEAWRAALALDRPCKAALKQEAASGQAVGTGARRCASLAKKWRTDTNITYGQRLGDTHYFLVLARIKALAGDHYLRPSTRQTRVTTRRAKEQKMGCLEVGNAVSLLTVARENPAYSIKGGAYSDGALTTLRRLLYRCDRKNFARSLERPAMEVKAGEAQTGCAKASRTDPATILLCEQAIIRIQRLLKANPNITQIEKNAAHAYTAYTLSKMIEMQLALGQKQKACDAAGFLDLTLDRVRLPVNGFQQILLEGATARRRNYSASCT